MNFEPLTSYIDSLPRAMVPGIDMIIYKDHKEIYRHFAGMRDRENGIPMDGNELYWIYSASKVFTVTAAMQLVEKGLLDLNASVGKYIPAYNILSINDNGHIRAPKTSMLIRHLFTMTGGLSYDLDSPSIQKAVFYSGKKAGTLDIAKAIAEEPLLFSPGEHFQYSLCHDVLAAVVEVVSGERFSDYVKNHILEPLGIKRAGYHAADNTGFARSYLYDEKTETSVPCAPDFKNRYILTDNYDSGGAGMYTCVEDYIKLSDALACGGVGATGNRILKSETIELMGTPQLTPELKKEFNGKVTQLGERYSYGFGVRVAVEEGPTGSPIGEFGWDGAANAYTLIDPENKLSVYVGMHILGFSYGYNVIHHKLRDLTYEVIK